MKHFIFWGIFPGFLLFSLFFTDEAFAKRYEHVKKNPKGNVFIIVCDSVEMRKTAEKGFSASEVNLNLITVPTGDSIKAAERILEMPEEKRKEIGGVIFLNEDKNGEKPGVNIGVYHYAFGDLAYEHINSPEYSFKFGSDSALLAINLRKSLPPGISVNIEPAAEMNAFLPRDILKKSISVQISSDKSLLTPETIGTTLFKAAKMFTEDEDYHVMGLVTDKARRHADIKNMEIRIHKYVYPSEELSEEDEKKRQEEMTKVFQTVKPFPSGLYYVSGLDRVAPFNYKIIDVAKSDDDFWKEPDEGSFVASSLQGVVRTVPVKLENYVPLENNYLEGKKSASMPEQMDYVIENVTVFDGTRDGKRFKADVGIAGDRIAVVGDLKNSLRKTTIDGTGKFLMPGFIDIHSHVDGNAIDVPYAPSHIRQGITSVLGGNCSFSPLGIGAFYRDVETEGCPVNIGMLIGNRAVRDKVMGRTKGMISYSLVYREKELVDLAMEEGAFGMSSGLIYSISEEAFAWELAELAKQMKPYGGFYASHVRGETDEVLDAVRECIYIGEIAEVPVQVSHMKVINRRNWGDMERYLDIMKEARARGMDVTGDQYPWRASGPAAHYRLHKLLVRNAIKAEEPEVVLLKDMPGKYKQYSGRPLTELLESENMTPEDLIEELNLTPESDIFATYLCLGEEDVKRPMKEDFVMVCTDASLVSEEDINNGKSTDDHPRKFRTYPEFFSRYVRDDKVCSWELGVYKCTALPAKKLGLEDRGVIKDGAFADLVLLDPEKLSPGTDYRTQEKNPEGIEWVFINGEAALKNGEMAHITAGRPLRHMGRNKP